MKSLLPIILLLPACGTHVMVDHKPATVGNRSYTTASELKEAADAYFRACDETGVQCSVYHLSLSVGDIGAHRAGVCSILWAADGRMHQRITIRPDYVNHYGVIWHELEHCTRFQEHTKGDTPHIMRSYAMGDEELAERPMSEWLNESLERDVRFKGYEHK